MLKRTRILILVALVTVAAGSLGSSSCLSSAKPPATVTASNAQALARALAAKALILLNDAGVLATETRAIVRTSGLPADRLAGFESAFTALQRAADAAIDRTVALSRAADPALAELRTVAASALTKLGLLRDAAVAVHAPAAALAVLDALKTVLETVQTLGG